MGSVCQNLNFVLHKNGCVTQGAADQQSKNHILQKEYFFLFSTSGGVYRVVLLWGAHFRTYLPRDSGDILQMADPRCGIAIWFNSLQPLARQLLMFAPLFVSLFVLLVGPLAWPSVWPSVWPSRLGAECCALKTFRRFRVNPNRRVIQMVTSLVRVGAVLALCRCCEEHDFSCHHRHSVFLSCGVVAPLWSVWRWLCPPPYKCRRLYLVSRLLATELQVNTDTPSV